MTHLTPGALGTVAVELAAEGLAGESQKEKAGQHIPGGKASGPQGTGVFACGMCSRAARNQVRADLSGLPLWGLPHPRSGEQGSVPSLETGCAHRAHYQDGTKLASYRNSLPPGLQLHWQERPPTLAYLGLLQAVASLGLEFWLLSSRPGQQPTETTPRHLHSVCCEPEGH